MDCFLSIHGNNNVCVDPFLSFQAAMLQTNMDKSAKPCDDFYDFACGGWAKKHVVTGDQTSFGQFAKLQEATSMKLKGGYTGY